MGKAKTDRIFDTDRRIRLGIWGLGRGMSFFKTCAELNIEVVAGCDFNEHMRRRFSDALPDAFVTDDEDAFLEQDFDAVLLATFCPDHADDAIKCLEAGKHVLSEVTAFHTLAEGVRLVEAVERSGLVYNLAENYPFIPDLRYLKRKWDEGLFGEFQYAEFDYIHECRTLQYTYIDGMPVEPGWTVHNWRSWLDFHYYNTHSLGPVMHITGARPMRVTALPGGVDLPGYVTQGGYIGGVTPSLIEFEGGALMRNLMGATTNGAHLQRLWGTRGAAERIDGRLRLRLGATGHGTKLEVEPTLDELGERAAATGHGGGDFWVLYHFANEIFNGVSAPFDIYRAADCTLPGILAHRSREQGGEPQDVPNLRKKADRDRVRHDDFAQPRYPVDKGVFPRRSDKAKTAKFAATMKSLILCATTWRAWADWRDTADDARDPEKIVPLADRVIELAPEMRKTVKAARELADLHPRSDGARVLREMLELVEPEVTLKRGFVDEVKKQRAALKRRIARRKK